MSNLAQRSITSASWSALASGISVAVLFVRSVILARLLPVEAFGVYVGATAVVGLTVIGATFGMGGAFLHRSPETENREQAARVHFTLKLLFTLGWAGVMIIGTLAFAEGPMRTALLLLVAATAGVQLTETPRLILIRRVVHRRLAAIQILNTLVITVVTVGLAFRGATLWALLAADVVTLGVMVVALYLWRPVWRPRVAWSGQIVRYYLRFGARTFLAGGLQNTLDRLDDLWTRLYLGVEALGFYSRAYTFATYPRRFLTTPVASVIAGTYAALKGDRKRLSQAFFRTNALMVRASFFLAGFVALVAPEFIRIALGRKWLPILLAFRLMLVFAMLDPIRGTIGSLFIAVGKPEKVVQTRMVQLAVMVLGLLTLGPPLGITGVALSVTAMALAGVGLLLWQARHFVDYSVVRLFAAPTITLVVGMLLARGAIVLPGVLGSDWRTGIVKAVVFCLAYGTMLTGLERRQLLENIERVRALFQAEAATRPEESR